MVDGASGLKDLDRSEGAWEFVVSRMTVNNLPKYNRERSKGLYLDVLRVVGLRGNLAAHSKVYGGMGAGVDGMYGRIVTQHQNLRFRLSHPSFHYTLLDLPDTDSTFYVFARFSDTGTKATAMVGEGVMISLLGLYEQKSFYDLLAGCGVLMCLQGIHRPIIGLNRDAGMVAC